MTSSLFDLGVFVSFEIKLNDLRFMWDSRPNILDLTTSRNDYTLLFASPAYLFE